MKRKKKEEKSFELELDCIGVRVLINIQAVDVLSFLVIIHHQQYFFFCISYFLLFCLWLSQGFRAINTSKPTWEHKKYQQRDAALIQTKKEEKKIYEVH